MFGGDLGVNGLRPIGGFIIFYGYYPSFDALYKPGQLWKKIIIPFICFRLGTWHRLFL